MSKTAVMEEIDKLYAGAPLVSGVEKMAISYGKQVMREDIVYGWHFTTHAPQVMKGDSIITFDEWYEGISPLAFEEELMANMFEAGDISFAEFKAFLRDDLKDLYDEWVENAKSYKVQKDETV